MKNCFLLMVLGCVVSMSHSFSAQGEPSEINLEIKFHSTTPDSGETIPLSFRGVYRGELKNTGDSTIPSGTEFEIFHQFGDEAPESYHANDFFQNYSPGQTSNLPPGGDAEDFFIESALDDDPGYKEHCWWVEIDGQAAKDTNCIGYEFVDESRDIGVRSISLVGQDGNRIFVSVNIENFGEDPIPPRQRFPFTLSFGESHREFTLTLPGPDGFESSMWMPGEVVQVAGSNVFFELEETGTFDLCAATLLEIDDNPDNDEYCTELTVTNLMEIADYSQMNVYPNPARDHLMIEPEHEWRGRAEISILDMSGRIIQSQSVMKNGTDAERIDVSDIEPGLYIYRVKTDNGTSEGRFIIQE